MVRVTDRKRWPAATYTVLAAIRDLLLKLIGEPPEPDPPTPSRPPARTGPTGSRCPITASRRIWRFSISSRFSLCSPVSAPASPKLRLGPRPTSHSPPQSQFWIFTHFTSKSPNFRHCDQGAIPHHPPGAPNSPPVHKRIERGIARRISVHLRPTCHQAPAGQPARP
jgi:hypothetical protein